VQLQLFGEDCHYSQFVGGDLVCFDPIRRGKCSHQELSMPSAVRVADLTSTVVNRR
jgi:hypothetical protein